MLSETIPNIEFGTSGLRGPATGFSNARVAAYIQAFIEVTDDVELVQQIFVGSDFRESSPTIVLACIEAIQSLGIRAVHAGNVPTPALASFSMQHDSPSIMVTGSHIPEEYNGIKFYRRDGELRKADEAPILERAKEILLQEFQRSPSSIPSVDMRISHTYVKRYIRAFPPDLLRDLKVGVYMHSAVGANLLVEILGALGATCFPYAHSAKFIAVDTEALDSQDIERAIIHIAKDDLDCVVSTDGDGDRPLLIAQNGAQINGDVMGTICARGLDIDCVVTPLSSTSAIEESNWFESVIRTKIGSPYVVSAMKEVTDPQKKIAGFEANGGFLLGSDLTLAHGNLSALPTRDAILPLLVTLNQSRVKSVPISDLAKELPPRFMKADRLKNVSAAQADIFLKNMEASSHFRTEFDPLLEKPSAINNHDGIRMTLSSGMIIHFRQSGNAPELRCYVETAEAEKTQLLLNKIMHKLQQHMQDTKAQ